MEQRPQPKTRSHAKTGSLPKIKNPSLVIRTHRNINDEMQKVRWSIAPKCLVPGHEGKQVMYICVHPQCQLPTRLVCEACFFKEHEVHNQSLLAVDEVKRGDVEKLRYWPFDAKFRKIFEFIARHEAYVSNLVQDINATFNDMAAKIIASIDKIRLQLLKSVDSFYLKETHKQKFIDKCKETLHSCFQLKDISEIVRRVFCKEIRHEVFAKGMNGLLNNEEMDRNRESFLKYFETSDRGKDMAFNKMAFLKKEQWIISQIEGQQDQLRQEPIADESSDGGGSSIYQTVQYLERQSDNLVPLTLQKRVLEDGTKYIGFYKDGFRELVGKRVYKNGFQYVGEWKRDGRSGWGVLENKAIGYRYEGAWKDDRKNGYGRESSLNWVFEGSFQFDKREGFGVLIEDGRRLEINWKNDKKHGTGRLIEKNGTESQVYYLNGTEAPSKSGKSGKSSHSAFDVKELAKKYSTVRTHQG